MIHNLIVGIDQYLDNFFQINFYILIIGIAIDLCIGDPVVKWHPIRLLGKLLLFFENILFKYNVKGISGGILLFLLLGIATILALSVIMVFTLVYLPLWVFLILMGVVFWSCVAFRDLIKHGNKIRKAIKKDDLPTARKWVGYLVGRDTSPLDAKGCGRGAIESLSENLVDGILSPLFWLMVSGPIGVTIYKIISTMDSMVGYKNERYLRFGWFGARAETPECWPRCPQSR